MTTRPAAPRYSIGDKVFAYHKTHAWVVADVKVVQANPKVVAPLPSAVSLRKREHSQYWYQVACNDPLAQCVGEVLGFVEDWNADVYDESMTTRPVDDLLSLVHLHDAAILRTLMVRYFQDIIYTNIGVIVVAVNPFNGNIPRYHESKMTSYLAERGQTISDKLLPHSWAQAHNTYHELCTSRKAQSILISGESGAGKTEAAKIVLKYLTHVSAVNGTAEEQQHAHRIAVAIASCSPILEAFGNAKTVRNDNSSRFGKLLHLRFHPLTQLFSGAEATNYLLERSRVMSCGQQERVYHSFYLAAAAPNAKDVLRLSSPLTQYKSLYAGGMLDNKEFSTTADYNEVSNAMTLLGLTQSRVTSVWKATSAIIHLANVAFVANPAGEGCLVDPATAHSLQEACTLWGLETLTLELTTTEITVMGAATRRLLPVHKALDVRDALCKGVYSAMFDWLIAECNIACAGDRSSPVATPLTIALLDIFGFESFGTNSFEQLCINFANETLQQHYNTYVFTKDMELCAREGINTVSLECPDLQPTLLLLTSIFSALDDQCALNGSESVFLEDVVKKHHKQHPCFLKDLTSKNTFGISHFAGDVTYNVDGWIEKNRDTLKDVFRTVVFPGADSSLNELSPLLFHPAVVVDASNGEQQAASPGRKKKPQGPPTVATTFRSQMASLLAVIESTNPRWIRCVKPHPEKVPKKLSGAYTLRQLEFSGILGTVKVRKAGYPVRYAHRDFCTQFMAMCPLPCRRLDEFSVAMAKEHAKTIIDVYVTLSAAQAVPDVHSATAAVGAPKIQLGATLVFLKSDAFYELERFRRDAMVARAVLIQSVGRGCARRVKVLHIKLAGVIQRAGRGYLNNKKLSAVYAEVHAAKLYERRKQREEMERQRAHEERQRAAEELRKRKELEAAQAEWLAGCQRGISNLINADAARRSEIEEEWAAMPNLLSAYEAIRELHRREAFAAFQIAQLVPLTAAADQARRAILLQELEEFKWLVHKERQRFMPIWIRDELIKVRRDEMKKRALLFADYDDDVVFLQRVEEAAHVQEHYRRRRLASQGQSSQPTPTGRFGSLIESLRGHTDPDAPLPRRVIQEALAFSPRTPSKAVSLFHTDTTSSPLAKQPPGCLPLSSPDDIEIGMWVHVKSSGVRGVVTQIVSRGLDGRSHLVAVHNAQSGETCWTDSTDLLRLTQQASSRTQQLLHIHAPPSQAVTTTTMRTSASLPRADSSNSASRDPASPFRQWRRQMVEGDVHKEQSVRRDHVAFSSWKDRAALLEDD